MVDIAKRKGLQLPKKLTKPILCDLLSKLAVNINASDPIPRIQNGKVMIGKRVCSTYKRTTLVKIARTLGISVDKSMSKEEICQKLKPAKRKSPIKKLPANLMKNIRKGKVVLKSTKRKNPSTGPSQKKKRPSPGPSQKKKSPSPNSNDENFSNLMNFAKKLRTM